MVRVFRDTIVLSAALALLAAAACAPGASTAPTTGIPSTGSTPQATAPGQAAAAPANGDPTQVSVAPSSSAASTVAATAPATGSASAPAGEIVYAIAPGSQAGYRVREQLARLSFPSDAVGTTQAITGSIALKPDGTVDSTNSKFIVQLDTLQSDKSMRDNFLRRNVLQTGQYPTATFVPTSVEGLPNPLPQSGNVSFKLTGNLTLLSVTKPVTWDFAGSVNGNQVTGKATTTFTFEDFNLNQPQVPVVLSIQDHITLEVDLNLQRQGS